jgi:hypothetical protein
MGGGSEKAQGEGKKRTTNALFGLALLLLSYLILETILGDSFTFVF